MSPDAVIARARQAQQQWEGTPLRRRLRVIRRLRALIATQATSLAASVTRRPAAQTLAGEILPLLDACRFVERSAPRVLASRSSRWRTLPLPGRARVSIEREPYGVVLVIGAANYGLMLAAIQAVQAIAAGNAVIVKPAPGSQAALARFAALFERSGLPSSLITVVDESTQTARALLDGAVDRLIFTGSKATGREVLARASERLLPAAMELSGWDPCIVLERADLDHVAAALTFALRFNGGETCVAPRRVLVAARSREALERRLIQRVPGLGETPFADGVTGAAATLIEDAIARGATLLAGRTGHGGATGPVVLSGVSPAMPIWSTELFGPIVLISEYSDVEAAIGDANRASHALGASVFGGEAEAVSVARQLHAGLVTINDVIFPLADPSVPLAPRDGSGFGVTRGAEGLLAMTRPKVVTRARSMRVSRLAYDTDPPAALLSACFRLVHCRGIAARGRALLDMVRALGGTRRPAHTLDDAAGTPLRHKHESSQSIT